MNNKYVSNMLRNPLLCISQTRYISDTAKGLSESIVYTNLIGFQLVVMKFSDFSKMSIGSLLHEHKIYLVANGKSYINTLPTQYFRGALITQSNI